MDIWGLGVIRIIVSWVHIGVPLFRETILGNYYVGSCIVIV